MDSVLLLVSVMVSVWALPLEKQSRSDWVISLVSWSALLLALALLMGWLR